MRPSRQDTFAVVAMIVWALPAQAEPRAGDIASAPESSEASVYLRGLTDGIEWAVSQSRFEKAPPFCAPPSLTIAAEQYRQILSEQIRLHPEQAQQRVGIVMMDALKRTFPCSGKP